MKVKSKTSTPLSGPYVPAQIQDGLYAQWLQAKLFVPDPAKPYYAVAMAPPNLTGTLHLGHALELSLGDTYLRFMRMRGKNVAWAPGCDHAGIATQAKYESTLSDSEKQKYFAASRTARVHAIKAWSKANSNRILAQVKALGVSVDWNNYHYTLDDDVATAVRYAFKTLYDANMIYRERRLVNWDVSLNTAISNIEIKTQQVKQKLYYVKYFFSDAPNYLVVATTRPETIFVDAALFINPKDQRYTSALHRFVINPLTKQKMPVLDDAYVDLNFGSGVLKCTPAHDADDWQLGKKHQLEAVACIDFDGKLNAAALQFAGEDRLKARPAIVAYLHEQGLIEREEEITSAVGFSDRSGAVIEPLPSTQWFVRLSALAPELLKYLKQNKTFKLHPRAYTKLLKNWLLNMEDWCISRQLVWGHPIPVWTHKKTKKLVVGNPPRKDQLHLYEADPDVLDTWFSSTLWPLVCFNWPNKTHTGAYPNALMIMGFDIIFFWGIKMMFQGLFHTKKMPFKTLLVHGLIRDANGKKMSKSVGNTIDPEAMAEKYGIDALRLCLVGQTSLGEDTNFHEERMVDAAAFLNKVWNAAKFITARNGQEKNHSVKELGVAETWILARLQKTQNDFAKLLERFEFGLALKTFQAFFWNDFCNGYLEISKHAPAELHSVVTSTLRKVLKASMQILHPYAPFLTERIYQALVGKDAFILQTKWPRANNTRNTHSNNFKHLIEAISLLRNFRAEAKLPLSQRLQITIVSTNKKIISLFKKNDTYLRVVNCEIQKFIEVAPENTKKLVGDGFEIVITDNNFNEQLINLQEKQINFLKAEINRAENILANPNFVTKAPKEKVDDERNKLAKHKENLAKLLSERK